MQTLIYRLFLIAVLLFVIVGCAWTGDIKISDNAVTMVNGEQKLVLSRSSTAFDYTTPLLSQTYTCIGNPSYSTFSFKQEIEAPVVKRESGRSLLSEKYLLADGNTLSITVIMVEGIPGFAVQTKLTNNNSGCMLGFRWTNSLEADQTITCSIDGASYASYDSIGRSNFVYLDECKWAVLKYGESRICIMTPGGLSKHWSRAVFINHMPSMLFTPNGKTIGHSFFLSEIKDPSEVPAIYKKVTRANINTVQTKIYPLKNVVYGTPAPASVQNLNTYGQSNYMETLEREPGQWVKDIGLWFSDQPVPDNIKILKRVNPDAWLLAYINWMEIYSKTQAQATGDMVLYNWNATKVGYEFLDIDAHPNWTAYDSAGNVKRSGYRPQSCFYTCMYQPDLQDAVKKVAAKVVEVGLDGMFVDNAFPMDECYGAKLDKHRHQSAFTTNDEAYLHTLEIAYDTTKSYGKDKIVFTNMGPFSFYPERWKYMDVQMWESAAFTAGNPIEIRAWKDLEYQGQLAQDAARHGKVSCSFDYYSDIPHQDQINGALFSFAYCKLYGMVWSDHRTIMDEQDNATKTTGQELYATRLGKPTSAVKKIGTVYYRSFENGLTAVNSSRFKKSLVAIPVKKAGTLAEISRHTQINPDRGRIRIDMEPMMGRVFLFK